MSDNLTTFVNQAIDAGLSLEQMENMVRDIAIREALKRKRNNQCRAAKVLAVHRNTLARSIGLLEIPVGRIR
jgi:transcriptional regulator with PAS, ATPase and Fis domain